LSLETGRVFKLNGNLINGGMITNLPADCCAEGPIIRRTGLHKRRRRPAPAMRGLN